MNNTIIINTFNSDNDNIVKIKAQYCQIMKNITNGILKLETIMKILIVANYTYLLLLLLALLISSLKSILKISPNGFIIF